MGLSILGTLDVKKQGRSPTKKEREYRRERHNWVVLKKGEKEGALWADEAGSGFIWLPRWSDLLNHLVTGSTLYNHGHHDGTPLSPLALTMHHAAKTTKASFCEATLYHRAVYLITRPWFYRSCRCTGKIDDGFVPVFSVLWSPSSPVPHFLLSSADSYVP